jgi:pyruvate kinase
MKRTKIVCTIGPASSSEKILTQLIKAGMNVARINFSHGTYPEHKRVINIIRRLSKKVDQPITILQDLQGPRIRVGIIRATGVVLQPQETAILTSDQKYKWQKDNPNKLPTTYANMHRDVKKGEEILLVDGLIRLKVRQIKGQDVICKIIMPGLVETHKGINLPQTKLSIPTITSKDKKDLEFGIKNDVDMVALSFVRSADDVRQAKRLINKFAQKYKKHNFPTKVIVKIEKPQAIKNFKTILQETDGVMVARGDLGIEMPADKVPLMQKKMIDDCLAAAKPVIVATQMLESMIVNPRPTRAEVSDVANAVIDHTDAVMLSGETANGKYPVEAVKTMARIAQRTEKSKYDDLQFRQALAYRLHIDDAISSSANLLARNLKVQAILVASLTGYSGRIVSRYRPELPILVTTNNEKVRQQLNLSWGVIPFVLPKCKTIEELIDKALIFIKKKKFVKTKDKVIIIAGFPLGESGNLNWIKIQEIK